MVTWVLLCSLAGSGCDEEPAATNESRLPRSPVLPTIQNPAADNQEFPVSEKIQKTDEQWRQELTPEQYHVLRQKGTEPAFTGRLYHVKDPGTYLCAACGQELFSSETKYESGSGWPSFYAPISPRAVETETDTSHGMVRTEVHCARCGGHLGHVFNDGPEPTGLRYCINSVSMEFRKAE